MQDLLICAGSLVDVDRLQHKRPQQEQQQEERQLQQQQRKQQDQFAP